VLHKAEQDISLGSINKPYKPSRQAPSVCGQQTLSPPLPPAHIPAPAMRSVVSTSLVSKPRERRAPCQGRSCTVLQLWMRGREKKEDRRSKGEGGTEERLSFLWRHLTCSQLCGASLSCGAASFSCLARLEYLQCCKNFRSFTYALWSVGNPAGLAVGQKQGRSPKAGSVFPERHNFSYSQGFAWFSCTFPLTLPLPLGSPLSAFDVDNIFLQQLGQSTSASFLHVFNSDLPTSHVFYCAPEYVSFWAMLFSLQP